MCRKKSSVRKIFAKAKHRSTNSRTFSVFLTSSANDMNSFHSFLVTAPHGKSRMERKGEKGGGGVQNQSDEDNIRGEGHLPVAVGAVD